MVNVTGSDNEEEVANSLVNSLITIGYTELRWDNIGSQSELSKHPKSVCKVINSNGKWYVFIVPDQYGTETENRFLGSVWDSASYLRYIVNSGNLLSYAKWGNNYWWYGKAGAKAQWELVQSLINNNLNVYQLPKEGVITGQCCFFERNLGPTIIHKPYWAYVATNGEVKWYDANGDQAPNNYVQQ